MTGDDEAYTVSKMLSSFNAVMAPVAQDPSASVSLKRKASNGVMLDTSAKEIAYLDTCAKVKHSAQRAAKLTRAEKAEWVDEQRECGNAAFQRREYARATDLYMQALAALDFGDSPTERERCQLDAQLPLTCNLAACMLMMEQWEKARQMCDEALRVKPTFIKALRQRARALTRLSEFARARDDVRAAIEATAAADALESDSSVLPQLTKQLQDIDRAERRHKQQLLQQKRFQTKMMREGVGRLYHDKQEPAVSEPQEATHSTQSESASVSVATRALAWINSVLASLLQLVALVLATAWRRLLRSAPPLAKAKDA